MSSGIHKVDAILSARTGRSSCIWYMIIPRNQTDRSYPEHVPVVKQEGRCKERAKIEERRRWRLESTFEAESSHWMDKELESASRSSISSSQQPMQSKTLLQAQEQYEIHVPAISYATILCLRLIQASHSINCLAAYPQV